VISPGNGELAGREELVLRAEAGGLAGSEITLPQAKRVDLIPEIEEFQSAD
jgi:hypothetical protein